jgi:hypothetical protein
MQRERGRASEVETSTRRGGIWRIREGKIVRVVWFPSAEEALEAAGLREEDAGGGRTSRLPAHCRLLSMRVSPSDLA